MRVGVPAGAYLYRKECRRASPRSRQETLLTLPPGCIQHNALLALSYTIGMKQPLIAGALGLLLMAGVHPVPGDTVKLNDRPAFRNVSISDFRDNLLVFRGVSGEYLKKPLAEVEWLAIDGRPHLTAAERAAATGNWPSTPFEMM